MSPVPQTFRAPSSITPDTNYEDPTVRGDPDELVVVVATSVSGSFDSVDYDGTTLSNGSNYVGTNQNGDDGLFRILDYNSDNVTVTNYLAVPGDANGDRLIDGTDFMIWSGSKFTAGNGWTTGDFNDDGAVDGHDFLIWNANKSTSVNSATAIPEPGSWCLLTGVVVFFVRGWRISTRAA